ncbi:type II toxin-antitoxin system RatA family toxin [Thiosocius teredinicola]|uniref:type II toxin-antitoxin system RatA family toxin n=1 Tax=Thiosocius teredinicola TaxID=1973002 RepID=UPI0009911F16
MTKVEKSALVPYPAQAMFDLVADVESYQHFLPWCSSSRLISRNERELCGEIEVSRLGISQTFSTCNRLEPPTRMGIALNEGPFKRLHGEWQFLVLRDDASKVMLTLEFEFAGRLIDAAFGKVFHQAANTLVESFVERAREVYRG